jgi:hypothetical protein
MSQDEILGAVESDARHLREGDCTQDFILGHFQPSLRD